MIFINKNPVNCILLHKFSLFYTILCLFNYFSHIFALKNQQFEKYSGHSTCVMEVEREGTPCLASHSSRHSIVVVKHSRTLWALLRGVTRSGPFELYKCKDNEK